MAEPASFKLFTYKYAEKDTPKSDYQLIKCIDKVGKFRVEYYRNTNGYFGSHNRLSCGTTEIAKFYQNDDLLFEKKVVGDLIILYGDGETLEKTYYTTDYTTDCEDDFDYKDIIIRNLKNDIIRKTRIGCEMPTELRKVNDRYMLSSTHYPYTAGGCQNSLGYIDMDIFFNESKSLHDTLTKPYDNARMGITPDDGLVPIEATAEGFIVRNLDDLESKSIILSYDKAFDFNFNEDSDNDIIVTLERFGLDPESIIKQLNTKDGNVSILWDKELEESSENNEKIITS